MMAAVASASLGDAGRGDDPTVNELERLVARLTGKDDALLVPSGAMANLAAVMAHGCRGGEVIVEEAAHIYNSEGGGLSAVAGAVPRPVRGRYGVLDPDDVRAAIRAGGDLVVAPTRLISLENTHNAAGGTVIPLENMAAIREVARRGGHSGPPGRRATLQRGGLPGRSRRRHLPVRGLGVVRAVQGARRPGRRGARG